MDEEMMALNKEAEEINSRAATPVAEEQAPEEVESVETEVATEVETDKTETEGEHGRTAQDRIRELNQKAKSAEEKAKSLEQKLAELTGSVNPTPGFNQNRSNQTPFNPLDPIVAEGEEISVAELNRRQAEREQRILQTADARVELRLKQQEAVSRINSEASEVIRSYPELDPESESYNPDLSEAVTEAIESAVKLNPYSASVKQIAAKLMKPYKGAVAREVGQATENIAKQVSQAALRPTTIRKTEKTASEKSIEELEQDLGIVHS